MFTRKFGIGFQVAPVSLEEPAFLNVLLCNLSLILQQHKNQQLMMSYSSVQKDCNLRKKCQF